MASELGGVEDEDERDGPNASATGVNHKGITSSRRNKPLSAALQSSTSRVTPIQGPPSQGAPSSRRRASPSGGARVGLPPSADNSAWHSENPQWLEYEVTSAAPRSNRRSGSCPLAEIPEDAVETVIIPPATYQQARDKTVSQPGGALRRRLMRHNPNPLVGFVHVAARHTIPLAALASLGVRSLGWATTAAILFALAPIPLTLFALAVCIAAALAVGAHMRNRMRNRRPAVKKTRLPSPEPKRQRLPLRYVNGSPPRVWTGATARSMSAGRVFNATDLRSIVTHEWRQFAHGLLPTRRK